MERATLGQAGKIISIFKDTSVEQVQRIIGSGILADVRDGNIGVINRSELRRILGFKTTSSLLDFVGTITFLVTTEKFIARDKFVINTRPKASVKISNLGGNFQKQFLDKIKIRPIKKSILHCYNLKKNSRDIPIINELGGEDIAETTLAELFTLIEWQGNGEDGDLSKNHLSVFYIRDNWEVLRAVDVHWASDGWDIRGRSIGNPEGWGSGCRVFSSNSKP